MESLQDMPIDFKSVRPVILAHKTHGLFIFGDIPGQTDAENVGIVDLAEAVILRLAKCFIETLSDPRIFVVQALLDDDHVHNGEYPRAAEIVRLHPLEIGEEPTHSRRAAKKTARHARRHQGVDLAALDHFVERLVLNNFETNIRRKIEVDPILATGLFLSSLKPMNLLWRDAVIIPQQPA